LAQANLAEVKAKQLAGELAEAASVSESRARHPEPGARPVGTAERDAWGEAASMSAGDLHVEVRASLGWIV
jgi:hypothetical protein